MRLGKGRSLDHYYSLTAMLAARGAQTLTSRVIAAMLFGLGLLTALAAVQRHRPAWARSDG